MPDIKRRVLFNLGRRGRRWRLTFDRLGDYMHRWYLFTPWFGLRVHKILRGDSDRDMHDHPFSFWSFILSGSYIEHTPGCKPRVFGFGDVNRRKAEDAHRLELDRGTVWTFVITGPYKREWGFHTEDGWVHNAEYEAYKRRRRA